MQCTLAESRSAALSRAGDASTLYYSPCAEYSRTCESLQLLGRYITSQSGLGQFQKDAFQILLLYADFLGSQTTSYKKSYDLLTRDTLNFYGGIMGLDIPGLREFLESLGGLLRERGAHLN